MNDEYALETLTRILKSTGMNEDDVDSLLAKFLEEEAFDFINYYYYSELTKKDLDDYAGMVC